jgi:hypothetical protein
MWRARKKYLKVFESMLSRSVTSNVIACCIEETEVTLRFLTEADIARWQISPDPCLQMRSRMYGPNRAIGERMDLLMG